MTVDVEKYRKRLLEERDQFDQHIDTVAENTHPPTDRQQLDAGDAHAIGEITSVNARITELKSERREQIDAALQRVDLGTYGTCERCGKEIEPARLDAEPMALHCANCAAIEEGEISTPTL